MSAWPWLLGVVAGVAGSYFVGWPAWSASRARRARDLNAERYLAWRGRAGRAPADQQMTQRERQRLIAAALLALAAAFCLVGFLTYA